MRESDLRKDTARWLLGSGFGDGWRKIQVFWDAWIPTSGSFSEVLFSLEPLLLVSNIGQMQPAVES